MRTTRRLLSLATLAATLLVFAAAPASAQSHAPTWGTSDTTVEVIGASEFQPD